MLGYWADSGSCATHSPPTALTAWAPAVPLDPMPLSTTHTARSRCSSARLRNRSSTGRLAALGPPSRGPRWRRPPRTVSTCPGRITYTWSGSTGTPSAAWRTGIVVRRARTSASTLSLSGGRCRTKTNAMPASGRMASRNAPNASSPPADAPTPTTGNGSRGGCSASTGCARRFGSASGGVAPGPGSGGTSSATPTPALGTGRRRPRRCDVAAGVSLSAAAVFASRGPPAVMSGVPRPLPIQLDPDAHGSPGAYCVTVRRRPIAVRNASGPGDHLPGPRR